MFGHIHEDPGLWVEDGVTFANVTTAEGELAPTVLDVHARHAAASVVLGRAASPAARATPAVYPRPRLHARTP